MIDVLSIIYQLTGVTKFSSLKSREAKEEAIRVLQDFTDKELAGALPKNLPIITCFYDKEQHPLIIIRGWKEREMLKEVED